jgi:hypothetical protein
MKSAPKPPGDGDSGHESRTHESRACAEPACALRAASGTAEWSGAMVRGLAALEFLERSIDMASEAVVAAPLKGCTRREGLRDLVSSATARLALTRP